MDIASPPLRDNGPCPVTRSSRGAWALCRRAQVQSPGVATPGSQPIVPQHTVLLAEVADDFLLLPAQPTGESQQEELKYGLDRCHATSLARSRTQRKGGLRRGRLKIKRIDPKAGSAGHGNHQGPLWKLVDRVLAQDAVRGQLKVKRID